MLKSATPVLGFAAYSGTGKTTLLTQLIPQLKQSGVVAGVIKHSHHNFDIGACDGGPSPNVDELDGTNVNAARRLFGDQQRCLVAEFAGDDHLLEIAAGQE